MNENLQKLTLILRSISNDDKLLILSYLEDSPLRLMELSRKLNISPQEAKRHISNLMHCNLIERLPDGRYTCTSLGIMFLNILKLTDNVIRFQDFLNNHLITHRTGEILMGMTQGTIILNGLDVIDSLTKVLGGAKKLLYVYMNGFSGVSERLLRLDREIDLRVIISREDIDKIERSVHRGSAFRVYDAEPSFNTVINESEAILFLKSKMGPIDFNQAIKGAGPFRKACVKLFLDIWKNAKCIPEFLTSISEY